MKKTRIKNVINCFFIAFFMLTLGGIVYAGGGAQQSQAGSSEVDDLSEQFTYSFALVNGAGTSATDFNSDDIAKKIEEKFNFRWGEVTFNNWADWVEKPRIWVASGDIPDMLMTEFHFEDYKNWYDQDLIAKLPADWKQKNPNLAKIYDANSSNPFLEKSVGNPPGTLLLARYYFNQPTTPIASHWSFFFRKDWARALGFEIKNAYKISEIVEMVDRFRTQGTRLPGYVSGQTDTFAISSTSAVNFFLQNAWGDAVDFYRDESGKIAWGPDHPRFFDLLSRMKSAIDSGVVSRNFASFRNDEEMLRFFTGQAFATMTHGWIGYVPSNYERFREVTGLDPFDSIQEAVVLNEEGNHVERAILQNWASVFFSPNMSQKKFNRLLNILDYQQTPEIYDLLHLGFEGKDYRRSGNDIVITKPKDANGNFMETYVMYPYSALFFHPLIVWDDFAMKDPAIDRRYQVPVETMWATKQKYGGDTGTMKEPDMDIVYFNGPNYIKRPNLTNDYIGLCTEAGDLRTNYNRWIQNMRPVIDPILQELNTALTGK